MTYTLAQLKTINDTTTGAITLNDATVDLSGSSSDLAAAFAGTITTHTGNVGITNNDYTLAELVSINNATSGTITLTHTDVAISGDSSDYSAALAGNINYTGNVTISNADYTVTELKNINNGTTGTITLQTTNTALTGDATDLKEALAGITNYAGNVTITDTSYTVAELKAINSTTTGTITLQNTGVALSGNSTDIAAAFAGTVTTHTGTVAITNADHTLSELQTINNATSGTITLTDYSVALNGTSAAISEALAGSFASTYTGTATLTDDHTLAELVAINNGTSGNITLNSNAVALTGSTSDVKAALAGNVGASYTGNIVINDADSTGIAATDITTIESDTSGTVTVSNNIAISRELQHR